MEVALLVCRAVVALIVLACAGVVGTALLVAGIFLWPWVRAFR
jgi:hypothetical protein